MSQKTSPKISKPELDLLRQKIVELCIRNPQKAALILSQWINSPANNAAERQLRSRAPEKTRKKAS